MTRLLKVVGIVLMLGGLAHSIGVVRFYVTHGVPDVNRMLLDTWVAEAHIVGGAMYFAAFRAMRDGRAWKGWSIAGALTILSYVAPFIPVLVVRAPAMFWVAPIVYGVLSLFIVWRVATWTRAAVPPGAAVGAEAHD